MGVSEDGVVGVGEGGGDGGGGVGGSVEGVGGDECGGVDGGWVCEGGELGVGVDGGGELGVSEDGVVGVGGGWNPSSALVPLLSVSVVVPLVSMPFREPLFLLRLWAPSAPIAAFPITPREPQQRKRRMKTKGGIPLFGVTPIAPPGPGPIAGAAVGTFEIGRASCRERV